LAMRHNLQAILRANIHATAAKDALRALVSLPSKIVLIQHLRQREASSRACSSV
jgi:hypothetical protein